MTVLNMQFADNLKERRKRLFYNSKIA